MEISAKLILGGVLLLSATLAKADEYPSVKFGTTVVGEHSIRDNGVKDGSKHQKLTTVEVAIDDYVYNGDTWTDFTITGKGSLYDITNEEPVLIKDFSLAFNKRGTNGLYLFPVMTLNVNEPIFENHTYKVTVPEDCVKPGITKLPCQFSAEVHSPAYEFTFVGSHSTLQNATMKTFEKENIVINELGRVRWYIEGTFELANPSGVHAYYDSGFTSPINGAPVYSKPVAEISLSYYNDRTYILADFFMNDKTGEPRTIRTKTDVTITLDEGTLVNVNSPEVKNAKYEIVVKGEPYTEPEELKIPDPIVIEPEYVNLAVTIDNRHSLNTKTAKGENASISILPDENWEVKSLTVNDEDCLANVSENGILTLEKVAEDKNINASLGYKGEVAIMDESGVAILPDSDIRILTDGEYIVIDGLEGNEEIRVYSVAGQLIVTHTASKDMVRIAVSHGAYIVLVGEKAAKVVL
ncbi:MAG: hypothetical protein HDS73_03675 [Bacteroidales bacterium]|nr:hypothetical protein [Bacteroidales bacterium]